MLVITGGGGRLGRLVLKHLLGRTAAANVAITTRNPETASDVAAQGITILTADYDDPVSLRSAFGKASRVLFISSPERDFQRKMQQHLAVVEAAADAKVEGFVYTSRNNPENLRGIPELHRATEEAIQNSGLRHSILRNVLYTENFALLDWKKAAQTGELRTFKADTPLNTASRHDQAEAAAVVLARGMPADRAFNFTGPELWTLAELASTLAAVAGRPVEYVGLEDQEAPLGQFGPSVRDGLFTTLTDDLRLLLGRPLATLKVVVERELA